MSLYISRHDKHLVLCKNIHFIDVWTLFHLIVSKLKKSMLCHNVKISYITCLTFAKIVSKTQSANMVLGFYTLHLQQWNLELSMTPLDPSPLANRRQIQVLHCITTKPELVYQIYGILLTFFPFIPSYLPFVFILLMFSRQLKSCNHYFPWLHVFYKFILVQ